ncbi:Hypothetical predicted protein [Marmota monax]|uniref:Uncharacterized protein n=1 Tax=Marmota monax TaxID=9995 RepID=A0A5E4BLK5_MARMO|nr:hypothetical protein GHT09_011971 [Marmota monax]VTJ70126.1 Hypothetical predicted protein [Marmota monax]
MTPRRNNHHVQRTIKMKNTMNLNRHNTIKPPMATAARHGKPLDLCPREARRPSAGNCPAAPCSPLDKAGLLTKLIHQGTPVPLREADSEQPPHHEMHSEAATSGLQNQQLHHGVLRDRLRWPFTLPSFGARSPQTMDPDLVPAPVLADQDSLLAMQVPALVHTLIQCLEPALGTRAWPSAPRF